MHFMQSNLTIPIETNNSKSWQFLFQLGGPTWVVNQGRRDSTTASLDAANNDIPAPTLDLSDLTKLFSNKGLSTTDMIALSGTERLQFLSFTIDLVHKSVQQ